MSLKLMYITNNTSVALAAEQCGVDRIWVDLETKGKEERQKNMNTVKSNHTIEDVRTMSQVLTRSELMVRINPWDENSPDEIEKVLEAGAQRIMLPMWKNEKEVQSFLDTVAKRVPTTLLLETKEAAESLDKVAELPLVDEIHIGLNDLHLSYGLDFMFQLLTNGTVDKLCAKLEAKNIPFGFGGIARIGSGLLPAENILCEHVRLKSRMVILSRAFLDSSVVTEFDRAKEIFSQELSKLRAKEEEFSHYNDTLFAQNLDNTAKLVDMITSKIRKERQS